MLIQKTKRIPAYLTIGKNDEMIKMRMRNKVLLELINSNNKKTRSKSNPINNGSDMNPEKVSTISGETAISIDEKRLGRRLLDALKLRRPTVKMLNVKNITFIHLAVVRKSPSCGVKRLNITGKSGGNSVTGVNEPFEFKIMAPFPA